MIIFDVVDGDKTYRVDAEHPYPELYDGKTPLWLGDPWRDTPQVPDVITDDCGWVLFDCVPSSVIERARRAIDGLGLCDDPFTDPTPYCLKALKNEFDDAGLVSSDFVVGAIY